MELIILTAVVFIFIVVQGQLLEQKRAKDRRLKIQEQWGCIPDREYAYDEFQSISHYYKKHKKNGYVVDDITWNDLDMDRIFMLINHTYSSVGQEYLYRQLREPVMEPEILRERNRLSEFFTRNKEIRETIQELFYKAGRTKQLALSDYIYHFTDFKQTGAKKHYVHLLLFLLSIGSIFVNSVFGVMFLVSMLAINIIQYYRVKGGIESYFRCIFYITGLLECSEELVRCKVPELNDYLIELKQINKTLGVIKKDVHLIQSGEGMKGSLADIIMDYVRMMTHIDLIAFYKILSKLQNHLTKIDRLIETLGQLESSIAVASFRKALPYYSLPELVKQRELIVEIKDVFHPLVAEPVANTIFEDTSVLLTGSNASGKSTFLKTVAINAILSQTIFTSISSSYKANFYRMYSSMALKDDLQNSESYYIVEIKSLKRILDQMDGDMPILCFIDEVLRGTNTVERIAASTEILKSLSNEKSLCFAATHDIELTYLLEDNFKNYHFREEITSDEITFSYMLYKGRTTTRNAIKLLQIIGYHSEIIHKAQQTAEQFMKTGKWK